MNKSFWTLVILFLKGLLKFFLIVLVYIILFLVWLFVDTILKGWKQY